MREVPILSFMCRENMFLVHEPEMGSLLLQHKQLWLILLLVFSLAAFGNAAGYLLDLYTLMIGLSGPCLSERGLQYHCGCKRRTRMCVWGTGLQ